MEGRHLHIPIHSHEGPIVKLFSRCCILNNFLASSLGKGKIENAEVKEEEAKTLDRAGVNFTNILRAAF